MECDSEQITRLEGKKKKTGRDTGIAMGFSHRVSKYKKKIGKSTDPLSMIISDDDEILSDDTEDDAIAKVAKASATVADATVAKAAPSPTARIMRFFMTSK